MNNQGCKIRTEIINLNTNEPMFYLYSIKINRCKGSCNKSITRMLKYVFLTKLKTNVKVFNLLSRTNETRHINGIKHVNVNVIIINKDGMMTDAYVNVKN